MRAIVKINMVECVDVETGEEVERTDQRYNEAIQALVYEELELSTDTGYEVIVEITDAVPVELH
jgi:hypothetical protein